MITENKSTIENQINIEMNTKNSRRDSTASSITSNATETSTAYERRSSNIPQNNETNSNRPITVGSRNRSKFLII